MTYLGCTLPVVFVFVCATLCALVIVRDATFYGYTGASPAEILRARGFQADEMFFTTSSGYRLRITRGRNPLIHNGRPHSHNARDPVLFVHGITLTANIFLINSSDVTPKDLSQTITLTNTSLENLNELLAHEPSAKSFPLLALNFGHEIFMLDRRGAPGSRELAEPSHAKATSVLNERPKENVKPIATSWLPYPLNNLYQIIAATLGSLNQQQVALQNPDPSFWNYSFDEQALVDFPETVDFVLAQTGRPKLALVTHSAGGPIALMSQSLFPERLARQISSAIYWAPAYSVSQNTPIASILFTMARPLLERYIGPVPSPFVSSLLQAYLGFVCSCPLVQMTICRAGLDLIAGRGGDRARPEFVSNFLFPSSSHELAQFPQVVEYKPLSLRRYDFGREGNLRAYGQDPPPAYNLSRLACRPNSMSFYVGTTDALVSVADVQLTSAQVEIPHRLHVIDDDKVGFGHDGFFFSNEAPRRAVIPSMQELQTLAGMGRCQMM